MTRKTGARSFKEVVAIVGDGYVEKYYFDNMKMHESNEEKWFQILPRLPNSSGNFDKAINKAIELANDGVDLAFAIVDIDQILSDGKIDDFRNKEREVKKINKKIDGKICLCYCNPCFEYWLLIHFKYTTKRFGECENVTLDLKDKITDYKKTKNYHSKNDLYGRLKSHLSTAIEHSERSKKDYLDNGTDDYHPISTIHKLFHYLRISTNY